MPIGFAVDIITPGEDRATDPGAIRIALEDDFDLSLIQQADGRWKKESVFDPLNGSLPMRMALFQHRFIKPTLMLE